MYEWGGFFHLQVTLEQYADDDDALNERGCSSQYSASVEFCHGLMKHENRCWNIFLLINSNNIF